jgi:uncharacterized protein (DUF1800 family)
MRRGALPPLLLLAAACAAPGPSRRGEAPPPAAEVERAAHALGRLGFGARAGEAEGVARAGVERWIAAQLDPGRLDERALDARLARLPALALSPEALAQRFPSRPAARAMARGALPAPADPEVRAVYETQLAARGAEPPPEDAAPVPEAGTLLALAPEERLPWLLGLAPSERRAVLRGVPPARRASLEQGLTPEQRELLVALDDPAKVAGGELAQAKVLRAVLARRQLLEVMTDLWEAHFNVFVRKEALPWLIGAYERDTIRPNAMGRFRDLLGATAHSPAMLVYLDGWRSVGPGSPRGRRSGGREGLNENYARELLELHTLGAVAGYTQRDVEEVARCFTGWTVDRPFQGGGFVYDPRRHEPGDKTVLGHVIREAGEREGEEVLDLLARDPRTAHRIAARLAVRFVADDPPGPLVERLARTFEASGGDVRATLAALFGAPEFWAPEARRAKLKTPLELVASAVRASGAEVEEAEPLVQALRRMGMEPYAMPTPDGWSWRADAWSGSGALAERIAFALRLSRNALPGVRLDAAALAGGAGDPATAQARLEAALLPGGVAAATHDVVAARAAAARGPEERDALVAGLLLASPDFQRR